jgi:uncharacterized membrane protein YbhN (UPF0104 family)
MSLVDYMGQSIIGYNAENYLLLIVGTAVGSVFLNYLFVRIQDKNTKTELTYLKILMVAYSILVILFLFFGVWLFEDYKYDSLVYYGTTIINISILLFHLKHIRRNIKNQRV